MMPRDLRTKGKALSPKECEELSADLDKRQERDLGAKDRLKSCTEKPRMSVETLVGL